MIGRLIRLQKTEKSGHLEYGEEREGKIYQYPEVGEQVRVGFRQTSPVKTVEKRKGTYYFETESGSKYKLIVLNGLTRAREMLREKEDG